MAKLRFRITRRLTRGCSTRSSQRIKKIIAVNGISEPQQNPGCVEPIVFLAAVEDHLERGQPEGQGPEADVIHPAAGTIAVLAEIGRVLKKPAP